MSFSHNRIKKEGLAEIAKSHNFGRLTHLYVEANKIKAGGVNDLAMSPHMVNLVHLNIKSNKIGNEGLQWLAVGSIRKLKYLNVQHNVVGEDGFRVIAESENFTKLAELKIFDGNQGATTEAKNTLKRAHTLQALRFIS